MSELLLVLIIVCALAFDYVNGFHDTANAIATVVSTRVLAPRAAILMAAVLNVAGALTGTRVAKTIAEGLVTDEAHTVILAAVLAAIRWNLITWYYGIPSSSSHALIGGLCGAALAHGGIEAVIWKGVVEKVVVPMVASPLLGFLLGFLVMGTIYAAQGGVHPGRIGRVFRPLQIVSSALMAFAHGSNDAQKCMGIITLALMSFGMLSTPDVPDWVILSCAAAMALGTAAGGYRIIKTMGHKIIRLEPVHGYAAERTAAAVIFGASTFGMPVSTTHVIAGSIFGVGASKRLSAVRWGVGQQMIAAWVLTLPMTMLVGGLLLTLLQVLKVR